jgi:hypothetical protein
MLFPCRFQRDLTDIIVLKHCFGFLTLLFFVVIQTPLEIFNLADAFKHSVILYILFLLLKNSHHITFIASMVLLAVSYLLTLKIKENNVVKQDTKDQLKLQITNDTLLQIQSYLHVFIIIIIILGFLSYLGSKKSEYNGKFNYFTFIFGKGSCANNVSKLTFLQGLKKAFS